MSPKKTGPKVSKSNRYIEELSPRQANKHAQKSIEKAMNKFKRGKLKDITGDKVADRVRAIAIGMSEATKEDKK